jgi:hypothetical protein
MQDQAVSGALYSADRSEPTRAQIAGRCPTEQCRPPSGPLTPLVCLALSRLLRALPHICAYSDSGLETSSDAEHTLIAQSG